MMQMGWRPSKNEMKSGAIIRPAERVRIILLRLDEKDPQPVWLWVVILRVLLTTPDSSACAFSQTEISLTKIIGKAKIAVCGCTNAMSHGVSPVKHFT